METVVWLGHDDNSATGLTGASGALRVWTDFMKQAAHSPINLDVPDGVESLWVDSRTGGLSDKSCRDAIELPFKKANQPKQKAPCQSRGLMDAIQDLFQ